MAQSYAGKVLFTLVVNTSDLPPGFVDNGKGTFSTDAKVNVINRMSGEPRVEQISFYYDGKEEHQRGVFTGVADGQSLIIMTDQGPTVKQEDNRAPDVEAFAVSVLTALGFQVAPPSKPNCTWTVVPLNELGNGFGTLVVEGMAGHSGD